MINGNTAAPIPGRHSAECKICSHRQRKEIERDFTLPSDSGTFVWRSRRSLNELARVGVTAPANLAHPPI